MKQLSERLEMLLVDIGRDPYRTADIYLIREAVALAKRVQICETRVLVLRSFEDDKWLEFDRGIDFPMEWIGKRVAIVPIEEDGE